VGLGLQLGRLVVESADLAGGLVQPGEGGVRAGGQDLLEHAGESGGLHCDVVCGHHHRQPGRCLEVRAGKLVFFLGCYFEQADMRLCLSRRGYCST